MKKPNIKYLVFALMLSCLVFGEPLNAQTPPPPPPTMDVNDVPDGTPINSLIGLTLLAGAIFGARKLKVKK